MSSAIYIYGNLDFLGKSAAAKRMLYYAKALNNETTKVYLVNCSQQKIQNENFIEVESGIFALKGTPLKYSIFGSYFFLKRLDAFARQNGRKSTYIIYPQSYFFLELWTVLYFLLLKEKKVFYEFNEVKKYYLFLYKSNSGQNLKALAKTFVHKIQFNLLDRMMGYYTGLICISSNIEEYGKKYNNNTIRIPILTNPNLKFETSVKTYSKEKFFNIGFSGSIVPKKENLLQFVEVLNSIFNRGFKVKLNLCGSVTPENLSLLRKASIRPDIIEYYGNLNERELSNFLIQQDLLIVPRGFTLQNKYGFSTKLSDYLNHKKVILVTDISDTAMYIKDGVNGFIVPPDDAREMTEKLHYIITNFKSIEASIIQQAEITSAKYFDYRRYHSALTTFLQEDA